MIVKNTKNVSDFKSSFVPLNQAPGLLYLKAQLLPPNVKTKLRDFFLASSLTVLYLFYKDVVIWWVQETKPD